MKALVIGATGSTGIFLVDELLKDNDYTSVVTFVRKPSGKEHSKLTEHIVNFDTVAFFKDQISGDVLFSCLGTTLKAAGSKEKQWKIDFDIPAAFALAAKQNEVKSFVLVSSYGASAKSSVFYSKMKGKLEDYIAELNFGQYIIFRPGPLVRENSDRLGEKISVKLFNFLNAIGILTKFKPLETQLLAQKLAKAPKILPEGKKIIELKEIFEF